MKGLLEQPTEILCRVVHHLSPWDIEAFTSTHSLLRGVGSQALAVHCEKKRRFAHLELCCNDTIHPLDLISALLEHEENPEYVRSLSVGCDNPITTKSKTSRKEIVHLLTKYPNLMAKVEHGMRASTLGGREVTFSANKDWNNFPHLYPTSEGGYAEDVMYFLMSLSSNLKLLRLVAEDRGYQPLQYMTISPLSARCTTAVPLCRLRELRLYEPLMTQWREILSGNDSLEILKVQNVIDNIDDIGASWKHPSLHTIVLQRSAVSAGTIRRLVHGTEVLRSFTYCYDDCGQEIQWEPHETLGCLRDKSSDRLVHLNMTHPMRELSIRYAFVGLQSDIWLLRDFKVLRTLRLESILLFRANVNGVAPLTKQSISTRKAPLLFKFEMGRLDVQELRYILPDSAAKVSLVGHLNREDAVATTTALAHLKARAPAFSELVLEEIPSRDTKGMRQGIQAECNNAKVSLRIFPTRLDAPPEVWWKGES